MSQAGPPAHDAPAPAPVERRSSGSTLTVLGAAAISGISGYVALIIAARSLTTAENSLFLVFWGVVFAIYGVLIGITTESTRAITSAPHATNGIRLVPVAVVFGLTLVGVVAASGLVWAPSVFGPDWEPLLGATALGGVLFTLHATLGGIASGRGAWSGYSLLVAGETIVRLVLFVVVAFTVASVAGFAFGSAVASGFWLAATLASKRYRDLFNQRVQIDVRGFVRRLVAACSAAGVSALLLVGYPVLLRLTTPDDVFAGAAPIVLAASLCRAPLLVPLGAYQNVVVAKVAANGVGALKVVVIVLGGLTALGALVAWPVGPWALRVVNPDYHVDGPVFAGLVVGAGLIAILTVTGAAALALDHHTVYLVGWITATAVAVVVLLLPWSLDGRVIGSLLIGPLAGIAVHLGLGHRRIG